MGKGSPTTRAAASSPTSRTYADAARPSRQPDTATAAKVVELEKANERLLKQLAELRRRGTDDDMDEDDESDENEREERIKVLTSNLRSVIAVYGEASPQHKECRDELDSLIRARREERPLQAQLQNVDRRIERQRQKADRLDEHAVELREKLAAIQEELNSTDKSLAEAKSGLADLEAERKALLLREAQQQEAQDAAGSRPQAPQQEEDAAWAQVVGAIQRRAARPDINPELASQVGSVLQLLHDLCGQLPPPPAQTTSTESQPAQRQHGGGGTSAKPPAPGPKPPSTPRDPKASEGSEVEATGHTAAPATSANGSGGGGSFTAALPTVLGPNGQRSNPGTGAAAAATNVPTPANGGDGDKGKHDSREPGTNANNDDELLEDCDMDVDAVINLLPSRHRSRVRDVIKNRADNEDGGEHEKNGARERERSPRPTKTGGAHDKEL